MEFEELGTAEREKFASMTPEQVLELAAQEGVELTEEQLDAVNGGWGLGLVPDRKIICGKCNKTHFYHSSWGNPTRCPHCGAPYEFVD